LAVVQNNGVIFKKACRALISIARGVNPEASMRTGIVARSEFLEEDNFACDEKFVFKKNIAFLN
jgi:hypothetical protein